MTDDDRSMLEGVADAIEGAGIEPDIQDREEYRRDVAALERIMAAERSSLLAAEHRAVAAGLRTVASLFEDAAQDHEAEAAKLEGTA